MVVNVKIRILRLFTLFLITSPLFQPCYAHNLQDLLSPVQNTFDWLDEIDTLENSTDDSQSFNFTDYHQADSKASLKNDRKTLRSYTQLELSDHFTIRPARVKAKPYDSPGSQKGYGLKFRYQFN